MKMDKIIRELERRISLLKNSFSKTDYNKGRLRGYENALIIVKHIQKDD